MRGFTLIELLVSVAIFTVVMVVALGALLAIAESDRKAQTLKTITNNLNFAVESMSRTIRTGKDYHCGSFSGGDCTGSGSTLIAFEAIDGNEWGYRWNSSGCPNNVGCIERSRDGGASWDAITAPEVVILNPSGGSGLTFYLVGSTQGDTLQPRVTILLRGYVQVTAALRSSFDLQTTVTQRLYDQ